MAIAKPARAIFLAAVTAALLAAAIAQTGSVGSGVTLSTNLPPGTVVWPGEVLQFSVQATSSRPGRLLLSLLDPPPGCVFTQEAPNLASKGTASSGTGSAALARGRVRWLVPTNAGGLRHLDFRAVDLSHPGQTKSLLVDVRVEGESSPVTMLVGDVTGDGVLDTVAGAVFADVSGKIDTGAVYVWKGVTAPSSAPDATLAVPGAVDYDNLGSAWKGQGIQLGDVTGDGVLDVIVGTNAADVSGVVNAGAVYVWNGGPTLSGTPAPLATLTIPGATNYDSLGNRSGQGIQLADVTGDGVLDIVTGSVAVTVNGVSAAGALYVWMGGPTLSGSPAPLATLTVPGAVTDDKLGMSMTQLVDVTGDGVLDIVAGSDYVDVAGVTDAGAIYVWKGGPTLVGTPAPLATLTVPGAIAGDMLGYVGDSPDQISLLAPGQVGRIADVTGDGVRDLIVGAVRATINGVGGAGAIYVWQGGAGLTGAPTPRATLTAPTAKANDLLGLIGDIGEEGLSGAGIQLADVNDDGVLDVVAGASNADIGIVTDAGAIYGWSGGATLVGMPGPTAMLTVPGAAAGDRLCDALGKGLLVGDIDSDGVVDLIAGTRHANVAGVVDAGAIYMWRGGATFGASSTPYATLTVPGAKAFDQLGSTTAGTNFKVGVSIQLADVTGEGDLDVVAMTPWADVVAGKTDGGAIYVWAGGPAFHGSLAPNATLFAQNGNTNDWLGGSTGVAQQGVQLVDVTGDGLLDVIAGASRFDVGNIQDAGMIFVWAGSSALSGSPVPLAQLRASDRVDTDLLGYGPGQSIQLADVTGDGVHDVIASTELKDVNGVTDVGGIYVWIGGSSLTGTLDPFAALTDPGAVRQDYLSSSRYQGHCLSDVTGDGILDVLGGAPQADVNRVADVGALYLWGGGVTLVGSPTMLAKLKVPGAKKSDLLTYWWSQ